jgi:hypothetical protein
MADEPVVVKNEAKVVLDEECVEKQTPIRDALMRTRIRSLLAIVVTMWAGAYLWQYTFTIADKMNTDAKFIAGFVTGSVVATIINFYFGSSEKQNVENK